MTTSLVRWPAADWPALARFIHEWNRRPGGGVHCLHAASGPDVASHAAELAALVPDEAAFWGVIAGDRLVGVFGCEFDPALGRAWMRGPLAVDAALLDTLHSFVGATLASALPESGSSTRSRRRKGRSSTAGMRRRAIHRSRCMRPCVPRSVLAGSADRVARAEARDLASVLALHEQLFPLRTSVKRVPSRLGRAECALFVVRDAGACRSATFTSGTSRGAGGLHRLPRVAPRIADADSARRC